MKWLIYTLLVLLASVAVALFALPDPGYVLIGYGNYSVETSLVLFVAFLLGLYAVVRLLAGLWHVPARLRGWEQRRRVLKARSRLDRAFVRLLEGDWQEAERRLARLIADGEAPLVAWLGAARAAQQLGSDARRDQYLQQARRHLPGADVAIGLEQAGLQLAAGQLPPAAATLDALRQLAPRRPRVLELRTEVARQMRDWSKLRELLPELRRRKVLEGEALQELTVQVYGNLLRRAVEARDLPALKELWADVPAAAARDAALLAVYAGGLLQLAADEDAEAVIRKGLARDWDRRLVYLYGNLRRGDAAAQLSTAEHWLQAHEHDPVLLLTLGKLCLRNELWGKARHYLEASIGRQPTAESYQLLGTLLQQLGEQDEAAEAWRKGVSLAAGKSAAALLPEF